MPSLDRLASARPRSWRRRGPRGGRWGSVLVAAGALGVAVALGVSGCGAGAAGPAVTTAVPTAVASPAPPAIDPGPAAVLEFPAVGAGAVGIAGADGSVQVLGQGGETATVPIASITKVITSLVVLDAHPLAGPGDPGPTITLGAADVERTEAIEAIGQFVEPMFEGQQVSLHDALAITLLTSANNYAETAAAWAFGSTDAYLEAARAWLAEQGLTATTLADASGLDPGSASTTADLLRVGALAHADPALAAIAGLASYEQPDLGTIVNQNVLLGEGGVDGLKTGSTTYAGATLLTSAVVTVGSSPVTLIAVVLGTESIDARFATTRALLASAQAGLREVRLSTAGQSFGSYAGADTGTASSESASSESASSESIDAVATADLTAVVFGDTPITTEVRLEPRTTGAAGDPTGSAAFTVGTARYELPLALAAPLG
ncbi:D-alanyl-D-alanine carboxypeptidase [Herbiconiux sp. CPCC 203407]|uniref:D-alanyl-D-alanine carboxypeptidase n=1 Tax=Herbiconiux oxytropis TaxID=2970915 RepID=A0AA42BTC5_9MICO|nr:D-alanyl-D-alanine carboxypeptidase [Herbiconiux oxytropis]MCS5722140.1 D-alanyl-D-alanine carboxypeptidase [Herbiconiux oxytropis]MCS5725722.1 D-alanyl-D-alanine carboxypeptidase [Herbiconiux oxytropis]